MSPPRPRLTRAFFARPALDLARDLLGQSLVRLHQGVRLAGVIVETEAYGGAEDLGCHARSGRTARNRSMWGPPGHAYIYFTYGMHWLLNLVAGQDGEPAAVLIRAVAPTEGLEAMRAHRPGRPDRALADGPAKLCQALGIDGNLDGCDLCAPGPGSSWRPAPRYRTRPWSPVPGSGYTRFPSPGRAYPGDSGRRLSVDRCPRPPTRATRE